MVPESHYRIARVSASPNNFSEPTPWVTALRGKVPGPRGSKTHYVTRDAAANVSRSAFGDGRSLPPP